MTWADVSEGAIWVVQQNTGRKLTILDTATCLRSSLSPSAIILAVGFETQGVPCDAA